MYGGYVLSPHSLLIKVHLKIVWNFTPVFHTMIVFKQHVDHNKHHRECLNTVVGELIVLGLNQLARGIPSLRKKMLT